MPDIKPSQELKYQKWLNVNKPKSPKRRNEPLLFTFVANDEVKPV